MPARCPPLGVPPRKPRESPRPPLESPRPPLGENPLPLDEKPRPIVIYQNGVALCKEYYVYNMHLTRNSIS